MEGNKDKNHTFFWMKNEVKYQCDNRRLCEILAFVFVNHEELKEYFEFMRDDLLIMASDEELLKTLYYKKDVKCTPWNIKNLFPSYFTL